MEVYQSIHLLNHPPTHPGRLLCPLAGALHQHGPRPPQPRLPLALLLFLLLFLYLLLFLILLLLLLPLPPLLSLRSSHTRFCPPRQMGPYPPMCPRKEEGQQPTGKPPTHPPTHPPTCPVAHSTPPSLPLPMEIQSLIQTHPSPPPTQLPYINNTSIRAPSFFIPGTQKGASSFLFRAINMHPQVLQVRPTHPPTQPLLSLPSPIHP